MKITKDTIVTLTFRAIDAQGKVLEDAVHVPLGQLGLLGGPGLGPLLCQHHQPPHKGPQPPCRLFRLGGEGVRVEREHRMKR